MSILLDNITDGRVDFLVVKGALNKCIDYLANHLCRLGQ
jgi:hypothetical protein